MVVEMPDDAELRRLLKDLEPLAREAWPRATDTWRQSLMHLAIQIFQFGGHVRNPAAIEALTAALEILAAHHRRSAP